MDALTDLARERSVELPPNLVDRLQVLRAQDSGLLATAQNCAACVMDAAACTVSLLLLCRAPVDLTPVGDVAGIVRAGTAHLAGTEIDEVDLGLSIVGLGATALVLFSGGTSLSVKAGAGLAKVARGAGRLSDGLSGLIRVAVRDGVDWARLPAVRNSDELAAAIRADAFAPLFATATDLTRAANPSTDRPSHNHPLNAALELSLKLGDQTAPPAALTMCATDGYCATGSRVTATLLAAWCAAQLCLWLRTPIPWMLGPLIVTALASMSAWLAPGRP